ncbi:MULTISPECIES: iron-containing alcohol dehydrogenase [unclassified Pseudoalteromonas]|uniref:iron-containing alcohol dehydrogenase n=1 Tax=unclassified Pseudoalteromonas TaxID=194690 RepID=UPI00235829D2|nr:MULTISPECIES: iron-containing alcohol dehydrogenase [unclassified Pseudoalteromonas]MDC9566058.1 iron-containing alcohol dehydrogenase [Pseudoalteromonas sp. GAB2316C]MDC9570376.1 iron-containing alcohol dehydrogenase [Pseudoalteromonas sp. GABNB9D]MDC9574529.1 iron-containing alcohol dehydrogenase [Pseudoalteromonas sp. GABNS16A]MDC9578901.1 iron-containing alcohol dehydrogenase [Pseudoalteromonas sp. GABNS16E]MDC9586508.1 iron-containing alcohol dehydrogenase [Pseudoalteromonas sp. GABNS1
MLNFAFKNRTEILFGKDQINEIASRVPSQGKVMFLYGGGSIKKNGVYDDVVNALEGVDFVEFSGVEPNPTYETLSKAVEIVKEQNVSFILPVGGGSVIDGAKYVAAAAKYEGDGWDILVNGAEVKSALPIGAVLTLPATGSESNGNSVVTRKETQQKRAFGTPIVQPQFAVLDPTYTFSLPTRQISNGVVDAFVHVIEQYLTYPVNAPLQDRFAEGILSTLIEQGPKALENPEDYDVRANVMWSATMALNGLIGQGVPQDWSTHMIGHELTALYSLDHAVTLAIVLPPLMFVQQEQKRAKIIQLGERVFGLDMQDKNELIDATIKHTQDFFEQMGIKTKLGDYDLGEDAVEAVANNLERNGMTALGEHGDIDIAKAKKILSLAL